MAGIYLSVDEMQKLYGLPSLAQRLYVFGIRPAMNYETGLSGSASKISWHGLAREIRIEPAPGIKEELPSKQQVRRAAQHLVKSGLVSECSEGLRLVFKCNLARLSSHVQIKADTKPTHQGERKPTQIRHSQVLEITGNSDGGADKADIEADTPKSGKPTHNGVTEINSLSIPTADKKFPMHVEWGVVDEERMWVVLGSRGFDVSVLSKLDKQVILDEFVTYWKGRPDQEFCQDAWEFRFCDSVAFAMERMG